ncbi:MAG: hypothetical protein EA403_14380 [Spirochaetaceae bacterium]|nr:MAG: hypothetical protein EA403_14380 [Spirochaetaceae bacterium]
MSLTIVYREGVSSETAEPRANLAHAMIAVYVGLAAVAVAIFFPGRSEAAQQLIAFSARYASLLLSALPLVVAAALWTSGASILRQFVAVSRSARSPGMEPTAPLRSDRRPSIVGQMLDAVAAPLSMEPRLSLHRPVSPVIVAASGAFHPVTVLSAALAFGINSGFFLFFVVFSAAIIIVSGAVARRILVPGRTSVDAGAPFPANHVVAAGAGRSMPAGVDVVAGDLYHRLRFALLGLLVAVAAHILIPDTAIRLFGQVPLVAVAAMVTFAAVLSVPPEVAPYAAALFFGRVPHGAVLAFLLVSAFGGARGFGAMTRAAGRRHALGFAVAAVLLTVLLTTPIRDLAAGALW